MIDLLLYQDRIMSLTHLTHYRKKYKNKFHKLRKNVKDLLYINAALCDQVSQIQERILVVKEERKFLLKKLFSYQQSPAKERNSTQKSQHNYANNMDTVVYKKPAKKKNPPQNDKPKPKKATNANLNKSKKLLHSIPLDNYGRPILPIVIGDLTVHSLGEVVSDRLSFHSEDYIYPVGFCSTRLYGSNKDPEKKCLYTCKILDSSHAPSFIISASNDISSHFVASNASDCHSILLRNINKTLGMDVVPTLGRGPEFFGFAHPIILNLIQTIPATKKCMNYKWNRFEVEKLSLDDHDCTLNFDALQRSITLSTSRIVPAINENLPAKLLSSPVSRTHHSYSSATLRDLLMA